VRHPLINSLISLRRGTRISWSDDRGIWCAL